MKEGVLEYCLKTVVKSSEIYPESRTSLHKNNIKRVMGQFSRISIKIQTTGPEKAVLIQTYPQISTFQRFCMYSTPPTGMDSYLKFSTHFSEQIHTFKFVLPLLQDLEETYFYFFQKSGTEYRYFHRQLSHLCIRILRCCTVSL